MSGQGFTLCHGAHVDRAGGRETLHDLASEQLRLALRRVKDRAGTTTDPEDRDSLIPTPSKLRLTTVKIRILPTKSD